MIERRLTFGGGGQSLGEMPGMPFGIQNRVAAIAKRCGERVDALLLERLASGQLDERCSEAHDLGEDVVECLRVPAGKCIGAVAPDAPERAPRQTYERAGQPRERRFSLEAAEDFGDDEGRGGHDAHDSAGAARSAAIIGP